MHFGIEGILGLGLYFAGMLAVVLSLWWPRIGLFYLTPLLPLQTTRYRMNHYPLGDSLVSIIIVAVSVGLLLRREGVFSKTAWSILLAIYTGYLLLTFLTGTTFLSSLPIEDTVLRFRDWIDYMMMPLLLLLVAGAITTKRDMAIVVCLMCLGILAVDGSFWLMLHNRDLSAYSDDLRDAGVLGQAGSNGLGAFEAQSALLLMVLATFQQKRIWRYAAYALAAFTVICLMYSFSRGAYMAFAAGCVFIGIAHQRKILLLLLLLGVSWATIVPSAVKERIGETESTGALDHSSEMRILLWEDALKVASENPVFGTGYDTYRFMQRVSGYYGAYQDTHNIYVKVLVETGLIGLLLFLLLAGKTLITGYRLFRDTEDVFSASLGLGLAAWVVCSAVGNFFGDRWTFLQVNGYMWILAGLVARALLLADSAESATTEGAGSPDETPLPLVTATHAV